MNLEIYNFSDVTSTNDYAQELLNQHNLVLVSALYQTQGRGRKGNDWFGSYGKNLFLSIGINHSKPTSANNLSLLQALAALVIKKALIKVTNSDIFKIKYPNDIYAKENDIYKKISGILIEHSFLGSSCTNSIIGIGINVLEDNFPEDLKSTSTSLEILNLIDIKNSLLKKDNALQILQDAIVEYFNYYYNFYIEEKYIDIFNEWSQELSIIGKDVLILDTNQKANVVQILEDCRLKAILYDNKKEVIIDNGNSIRYQFD